MDFWISGFLDFLISGFLNFWIFGFLDFWIFGFSDFWIIGFFEFLDFWIFGFLDFFWISGYILATKRATGDLLVSKLPDFSELFRILKKKIDFWIFFWISGSILAKKKIQRSTALWAIVYGASNEIREIEVCKKCPKVKPYCVPIFDPII